jgi:hypothetical protein
MIAFRVAIVAVAGILIAGSSNSLTAQVGGVQPQAAQTPPARAEL